MRPNPFCVLPETVTIDGIAYPIDYDYRVGVAIEREALEHDKPDAEGLLYLFYKGNIPANVGKALRQMLWFYQAPTQESEGGQEKEKSQQGGRWYDFEQDRDVLLASFFSAYGIDLSTAKVHWWTFRRLMLNLPTDSRFMERVHYRTADLSKLSKDQKKHYRKMKALYAIKDKRAEHHKTVEESEAALLEKVRKRFQEAQAQKPEP